MKQIDRFISAKVQKFIEEKNRKIGLARQGRLECREIALPRGARALRFGDENLIYLTPAFSSTPRIPPPKIG